MVVLGQRSMVGLPGEDVGLRVSTSIPPATPCTFHTGLGLPEGGGGGPLRSTAELP